MTLKKSILFLFFISCFSAVHSQEINWRYLDGNKGANFYDIQKNFNEDWKGKTPKKGQGFNVYKRWEARMKPKVYPTGNLGLTQQLLDNYMSWSRSNNVSSRSPSGNWVEVGPLLKPIGYDAGVGRVDFIKFSPNNASTAYVSTPDGGLWRTTNLNDALPTWTTYNDFLTVIGCSDLVIAPNGTTMYLATGSWEADKNSVGVIKSINGGETWTATNMTFALSDNYKIRRLIMDPNDPDIMLIATDGGVYRTTDGWATRTLTSLSGSFNMHDIKFKPTDSQVVYASGKHVGSPLLNEVFWRSADNGATWTNISSGTPDNADISRMIIGVSVANASYVYILAGNTEGGYKGLYRSTDSGFNFSTQSTTPNILNTDYPATDNKGQASHDLAIAIAPNNINKVTVGGINQVRSTDGGATWNLLTYWNGLDANFPTRGSRMEPYLHADVQSITYLPGSSTTIYTSCDGSISRSTDDGVSWTDISNNLRIAQQTDIALSTNDAIMVAGLQDIGNLKNVGAPAWTYIGGGDGEGTFIDYNNNNNIVTSEPNGGHNFSNDAGASKNSLAGNGIPEGTEFYSPIMQDPSVSTTCYAGGRPELYISTNYQNAANDPQTHSWSSIGTPSGTGSVLKFVVAPSNTQVIYTIKEDAISKTIDGGANWTNVTGTLPVGTVFPKSIAVSNTDPNKVWIVFSGYSATDKVFKSTNGGSTWTNISTGLPNIPMNVIRYRSNSANNEVYVGGDIGVYVINDNETSWVPFKTGLANCTVNDLEIHYGKGIIRAATYGRGAWESNLYTGSATALVSAKVFLEGPFNASLGKMNDGLRASHFVPTVDPYPALGLTHTMGEIEGTNAAILIKDDANNAIVDWVFLELRDKNNPATVLFTRSALVQRDGDVVDMDGTSPVHFSNAGSDNYYIAIRHRNHLGFRTSAPVALSGTASTLNFTDNSVGIYGTNALKLLPSGQYVMYAGDANGDGEINAVDNNSYWKLQNSQIGYKRPDFNLDGEVNAVDRNLFWKVNNSKVQQLD